MPLLDAVLRPSTGSLFSCTVLAASILAASLSACGSSPSEPAPAETLRQAVGTTELQFELPSSLSPRSAAVAATETLRLEDRVQVRDATGTVPAPIANVGAGETNLGMDASSGSIVSVGNVVLRGRNDQSVFNVFGDVQTSGTLRLENHAAVSGAQQQGAEIRTHRPTLQTDVPFVAGVDDNLQNERAATYAPGNYGRVHVFSRSRLTLQAGDYFFESLALEPEAVIVLENSERPVRLFVRERFYFHGAFEEQAQGDIEANVLVYYLGNQDTHLHKPFLGTIYAPNAHLILDTLPQGQVHRGAFFARSVTVRPDVRILHKPFRSNLIGKVTLSKAEICANEEVRVDVEPLLSSGDVRFTIDGMVTDHRYVQFRSTLPGPRRITVTAKRGSEVEHRTVTVDLIECAPANTAHPFVVVGPDREGQRVDFRVLNSGDLAGEDKTYLWEFGDGQSEETNLPYARHDYTRSLNTTDLTQVFDAKLTVLRGGLPDLVTHKTVVHYNHYADMRARGVIPVDVLSHLEPDAIGSETLFAFRVFNREPSTLQFATASIERQFCDPERDPELIETRAAPFTVPPGAEQLLALRVANAELDNATCGVAIQFTGEHAGRPMFARHAFEVARSPFDARRVTDPEALAKLRALADTGYLLREDGTLHGEDLLLALKQGRITKDDLPAPPSGASVATATSPSGSLSGIRLARIGGGSGVTAAQAQLGATCDPADPQPTGYACVPDLDAEPIYSGAYVRNALKGDLLLNQKCSLIGALFNELGINYSHEAIMTRNYTSLAHTTREQDLIMNRALFGWGDNYLTYGFPGAIRETVEDAFTEHEIHWPDQDKDVTLHGFDQIATVCTWDTMAKPMLVVRPFPGEENLAEARTKLRKVADFARRGGESDTHYRFYSFSEGKISFDTDYDDPCNVRPYQCESGNARERAAASATYLWWMLKENGVLLEGTELEPWEVARGVQAADLGTGWPLRTQGLNPSDRKDGLYYYSAGQREAAAIWFRDHLYNMVLDGLTGHYITDLAGKFTPVDLERIANARALQLTACFTKDRCHGLALPGVELVTPPPGLIVEDIALHANLTAAVYNPGDGHTVNPDEFLNWDRPSLGGAYGYSERMAYGDFQVIYPHRVVEAENRSARLCIFDDVDGLPVRSLRVTYNNGSGEGLTDEGGCVELSGLSVGEQELTYTCNNRVGLPREDDDDEPEIDPDSLSCSHATCAQSLDGVILLHVASVEDSPDDPLPGLERCGDAHCVWADLTVDESQRTLIARGLAYLAKDSGWFRSDSHRARDFLLTCNLPSQGGALEVYPGFPYEEWGPDEDRVSENLGCTDKRVTHRAEMRCVLLPNDDVEVTLTAITYRDRDVVPNCARKNKETLSRTFVVSPHERAGATLVLAKGSARLTSEDSRDQTWLWFGVEPPPSIQSSWNKTACWGSDARCAHPALATWSEADEADIGGYCGEELFGIWNVANY